MSLDPAYEGMCSATEAAELAGEGGLGSRVGEDVLS